MNRLPSPLASFSLGLFVFVFALFIIHYSLAQSAKLGLFIRAVHAAENPFPSGNVPCSDTADPNFHSLRPYQANPCKEGIADEALFCGNDLVLKDTIRVSKSDTTKCEDLGGGKERCFFHLADRSADVAIDLSGASLPIAGNTELVKNSRSSKETLDDAQKVNEYASWYLNGTINRAEQPFVGVRDPENIRKIVDFSGPLNKLLPQEIQWLSRIKTVEDAVSAKKGEGTERHDQIVGCTYGINIFGHEVGGIPSPCYDKSLVSLLLPEEAHWLSEWKEKNKLPPLRKDFDSFEKYWKAVQNWRGKFCPIIPIPTWVPFLGGKEILLFCGLQNPFEPDFYANLFSYIPYSSTEDREGEVKVETVSPQQQGDVTVSDISFSDQAPAELFFAHMEELNDLASLVQSTFVPYGEDKVGKAGISGPAARNSCDIAQIRTNPGDNLFAGEISGNLKYTADFSCDFSRPEGSGASCVPVQGLADCPDGETCNANGRCVPVGQNEPCNKDVFVNLSLITKTPLADEVYLRLVDGPASVFKRLFPKIGEGGPLTHLLDIPAATKVDYKSLTDLKLVYAGNPGNERKGEEAELYFPHLGSVSEYFLKGIQTLLRPKGFGEEILSGQSKTGQLKDEEEPASCRAGGAPGSYPELPKANGACRLNLAKSGNFKITIPEELRKIIEAAAAAYKVPPSLIVAAMYTEGNWSYKAQASQWTNENVKKWASGCAIMPSCNPDSYPNQMGGVIAFTQKSYWDTLGDAVKVVDPKREPNQCNLMDAIFAIAKNLATNHTGSPSFAGRTCFGIPLNAGGGKQNSCSWNNSSVETAWKMQTNGIDPICLTKAGSLIGGDKAAACGPDFLDTCETLSSWSSGGGSSLNAGFWNLYQSLK